MNNVLSLFVEAYLQEMGGSADESVEVRNRKITHILLALYGWKTGSCDDILCEECGRHIGLWNFKNALNVALCDVGALYIVDL